MQSSVALLSLFHMSSMKPTGIKLLESAAAERDPSEWLPHVPPGLGSAAAQGPSSTTALGAAPLGTSVPASSGALSGTQAAAAGGAGTTGPPSNGGSAGNAAPTTSFLGPTTSGSSSSSSHMSFGVVLGRLMPLLDDEISHGHSEDDERSIAGDSWSVKSEYGSTLDGDDGMRAYELTVGGLTIAEGSSPPRGSSNVGGEHEMGEESEGGSSERSRGHALAGPAGRSHSFEGGEGHPPVLPTFVGGSASAFPGSAGARGAANVLGHPGAGSSSSSRASSVDGMSGRLGGVRESLEEEEEEEEEEGSIASGKSGEGKEVVSGSDRTQGPFEPSAVQGGVTDEVSRPAGDSVESESTAQGKEEGAAAGEKGPEGKGPAHEEEEDEKEKDNGEKKDEDDEEEDEEASVLGLRSHWESTYAEELATFYETGEKGDVWFGRAVMDAMAEWTAELAAREASKAPAHVSPGGYPARDLAAESSGAGKEEEGGTSGNPSEGTNGRRALGGGSSSGATEQGASSVLEMRQPLAVYPKRTTCGSAVRWKVLDIGTGNGLLLHALAKHGFQDLTGTDYCEDAIRLAHAVAARAHEEAESRTKAKPANAGEADTARGSSSLVLVVDDILHSTLEGPFQLVVDKGTLDAVNLHPDDAAANREKYKASVARLLAPGGLLVITSCNRTKDELIAMITRPLGQGAEGPSEPSAASGKNSQAEEGMSGGGTSSNDASSMAGGDVPRESKGAFEAVDFMRSYPKFRFGGAEGTTVCTVAFRKCVL